MKKITLILLVFLIGVSCKKNEQDSKYPSHTRGMEILAGKLRKMEPAIPKAALLKFSEIQEILLKTATHLPGGIHLPMAVALPIPPERI